MYCSVHTVYSIIQYRRGKQIDNEKRQRYDKNMRINLQSAANETYKEKTENNERKIKIEL